MSEKQIATNTNTNTNTSVEPTTIVAKKRGRKSKKEIELEKAKLEQQTQLQANNINVIIEETDDKEINKVLNENIIDELLQIKEFVNAKESDNFKGDNNTALFSSSDHNVLTGEENKPPAKKRGRKPKGGKIIQQIVPLLNVKETKPNIILHLKCSIKDLHTDTANNLGIQGFDLQKTSQLSYNNITTDTNVLTNNYSANDIISSNQKTAIENDVYCDDDCDYDYEENHSVKENDIREVWKKLKVLEHNLHLNNICDKKSACFWCTYDFDNPPVYIPKNYIKDSYHVYGCFCSPECATAHLMEENIDSSAKFERYYLLNHIYSKIYDYKKNIKPAPNPYYMLDKYYGNLTIQDYRALLKNERLFLVVDKPLTRILPELHEDNDDFIINNKIIPSNTYQIKKKLQRKQTKTNILSEKFGLQQ